MTVFDNIRTNNWPSDSKELDDYLVVSMPLNDADGFNETLPVKAGSKTIRPAHSVTNNGVYASVSDNFGGYTASGDRTDYPHKNIFNGNSGSYAYGSVNQSITLTFTSDFPTVNTLRVYASQAGTTTNLFKLNGTDYSSSATSAGWNTIANPPSTLTTLLYGTTDGSNYFGIGAIEVNGVLLERLPGGKKHYEMTADFAPGSSDKYLKIGASSDFYFGNEPFCIECYANIPSTTTESALWDLDTDAGYSGTENWMAAYYDATNMYFYWGTATAYVGVATTQTLDEWVHWAWTWDGTTARLFKNGSLAASDSSTGKTHWGASNRPMYIGKQNLLTRYGEAKIQDLRIYKGVAKYTSNFTPPGAILS